MTGLCPWNTMQPVSLLLTLGLGLGLALATAASHHHHRWDEARSSTPSRYRHPLRHHGQDASREAGGGAAGTGTGLDQLINRLDSMNHLGTPSYDYWSRHKSPSSSLSGDGLELDNQVALEELRQAVEDYERGEVLPDVKSARKTAHAPSLAHHRSANVKDVASRTSSRDETDAKRRDRIDALLDDDNDDDDENDDDDDDDDDDVDVDDGDAETDEDNKGDSRVASAEDADSEEADKGTSPEDMDMDYKDPHTSDMSQVRPRRSFLVAAALFAVRTQTEQGRSRQTRLHDV